MTAPLPLPSTFWETLPRPLVGLAPMNGITDHTFRHIQKKYGRPMLLYTEFTSVAGLCAGAAALLADLRYDESQRPIIAQVYGRVPDQFRQSAILLCQLGFDGIDLNMGCPARGIAYRGAGAGLIRTPDLAQAIVRAAQQGVQEWRNGATVRDCPDIPPSLAAAIEARHRQLPPAYQQRRPVPVSVKTRIGYAARQVDEWIPRLLECRPAALAIHGRTLAQGYAGDADWEAIAAAAELARGSGTLILGNGDLRSGADARRRAALYGLDGGLIGRASYGNPFVFHLTPAHVDDGSAAPAVSGPTLLRIALEHARLYDAQIAAGERRHFLPMRKHLAWYVTGVPSASHLRRTLTQAASLDAAVAAIDGYLAGWRAPL